MLAAKSGSEIVKQAQPDCVQREKQSDCGREGTDGEDGVQAAEDAAKDHHLADARINLTINC